MSSDDLNMVAEEVVKGILDAYRELTRITGKPLPIDLVSRMLREALHIAVHELAHAALRTSYPELDHLTHSEDRLGECVDEIAARILELVISERLGLATHSLDEHVYELKHYSSLANLPISVEDLRELYGKAVKSAEAGDVRKVVELVLSKCREWVSNEP